MQLQNKNRRLRDDMGYNAPITFTKEAAMSWTPVQPDIDIDIDVDALAQEIRRVNGDHKLGAGALAEALAPFINKGWHLTQAAREPFGWLVVGQTTTLFARSSTRPDLKHINGFDNVVSMIPLRPLPCAMAADLDRLRLLERQAAYETALSTPPSTETPAPGANVAQLALSALRYYKELCSGHEPSTSVFDRMVDEVLAAAASAPSAAFDPAASEPRPA